MTMSEEETLRIQQKYSDLINYASENFDDPIDPIYYRDSGGDSLLHIAVQRNDEPTIASLLKAGVDINIQGDMGYTPLHYAASFKNKSLIALLIRYGARTDIEDEFGCVPDVAS